MADETTPEAAGPRADVGAAVSWAFDRFKTNAAAFVGLAAVVTVIQLVQQVGTRPLQNIVVDCSNPDSPGQINACTAAVGVSAIAAIAIALVFSLLAFIAQIGVQRAAIRSTQGITPTFSEMFTTQNLGKYILFVIAFAILFVVGLALCILPGLVVLFLLQLGPYYILDKGMSVGDAMKASVSAVTKNIGPAIFMTLINGLVAILGGMFFGILTLVTLPFACLFTAHMYRQFNREPVA
ncbi:MAG: hypothetical protein NTX29_06375 [Actinobacteria bacterium]|nr:hypothetical protein [Actinomycetota bacterium]